MITADKLALLTNLPAVMLSYAIQESGYPEDKFIRARFVGLNNANQFCYECTYEDNVGNEDTCMVYLTYDEQADKVNADY